VVAACFEARKLKWSSCQGQDFSLSAIKMMMSKTHKQDELVKVKFSGCLNARPRGRM
jgi:hypothetical protein